MNVLMVDTNDLLSYFNLIWIRPEFDVGAPGTHRKEEEEYNLIRLEHGLSRSEQI